MSKKATNARHVPVGTRFQYAGEIFVRSYLYGEVTDFLCIDGWNHIVGILENGNKVVHVSADVEVLMEQPKIYASHIKVGQKFVCDGKTYTRVTVYKTDEWVRALDENYTIITFSSDTLVEECEE